MQHPAVEAAAVVGLPHVRLGEQVAALVQLRKGFNRTSGQCGPSKSHAKMRSDLDTMGLFGHKSHDGVQMLGQVRHS